jgi:hypothetical protein
VAIELSWRQILAWRLKRHHLTERAPRSEMLDVIARIGGLHAQLMSSAELTLWARVEGLEREAVTEALWEERSLVKLGPCGARSTSSRPPSLTPGWARSAPTSTT